MGRNVKFDRMVVVDCMNKQTSWNYEIFKLNKFFGYFWPQACNFIKKETPTQMFSCEFCEILRKPFLQNTCFWSLAFRHFVSSRIFQYCFKLYFFVCMKIEETFSVLEHLNRVKFCKLIKTYLLNA